jgi:hypothetical protein
MAITAVVTSLPRHPTFGLAMTGTTANGNGPSTSERFTKVRAQSLDNCFMNYIIISNLEDVYAPPSSLPTIPSSIKDYSSNANHKSIPNIQSSEDMVAQLWFLQPRVAASVPNGPAALEPTFHMHLL